MTCRPELIVKKLRHYARGAVAALLLRQDDMLRGKYYMVMLGLLAMK